MRMLLVTMYLAFALFACSEKKEIKDTVFAPAVQAKDKARAVEGKLKEAAEKNREALKALEQGAGADQQQGGY